MLKLKLDEFVNLPVIEAYWEDGKREGYDIWLSARERGERGLVWIAVCPNKTYILLGAPATVHYGWKKKWHQGVIKLPPNHKACKIYHENEWGIDLGTEDVLKIFESREVYDYHFNVEIFPTSLPDKEKAKIELTMWPEYKKAKLRLYFPFLDNHEYDLYFYNEEYEKLTPLLTPEYGHMEYFNMSW
jgi:hypothetical protein